MSSTKKATLKRVVKCVEVVESVQSTKVFISLNPLSNWPLLIPVLACGILPTNLVFACIFYRKTLIPLPATLSFAPEARCVLRGSE